MVAESATEFQGRPLTGTWIEDADLSGRKRKTVQLDHQVDVVGRRAELT